MAKSPINQGMAGLMAVLMAALLLVVLDGHAALAQKPIQLSCDVQNDGTGFTIKVRLPVIL